MKDYDEQFDMDDVTSDGLEIEEEVPRLEDILREYGKSRYNAYLSAESEEKRLELKKALVADYFGDEISQKSRHRVTLIKHEVELSATTEFINALEGVGSLEELDRASADHYASAYPLFTLMNNEDEAYEEVDNLIGEYFYPQLEKATQIEDSCKRAKLLRPLAIKTIKKEIKDLISEYEADFDDNDFDDNDFDDEDFEETAKELALFEYKIKEVKRTRGEVELYDALLINSFPSEATAIYETRKQKKKLKKAAKKKRKLHVSEYMIDEMPEFWPIVPFLWFVSLFWALEVVTVKKFRGLFSLIKLLVFAAVGIACAAVGLVIFIPLLLAWLVWVSKGAILLLAVLGGVAFGVYSAIQAGWFDFEDSDTTETEVYCSVQYVLNGGENSQNNPTSFLVHNGSDISLANPSRNGYIFDGWYMDSEFKERIYDIDPRFEKDYIVYAKWIEVFKITFHLDSTRTHVVEFNENSYVYDEFDSLNNVKSSDGKYYVFAGWKLTDDESDTDFVCTLNDILERNSIGNYDLYPKFELATEGLEYSIHDNGTADIIGYDGDDENVIIPNYYCGRTVDCIATNAFQYNHTIKTVEIGDKIKCISMGAFEYSGITAINIPNTVELGYDAFSHCSSLVEATINCETIPENAFSNSALERVYIGEDVKCIGAYAFVRCYNLISVTFGKPVGWTTNYGQSIDLSNSSTAAKYLKYYSGSDGGYGDYKWTRT